MDNSTKFAINNLRQLLIRILNTGSPRKARLVKEFEDLLNDYWEKKENAFPQEISDLFAGLITDMAYYQSNLIIRLLDKNLIDEKQLDTLIQGSLETLEQLEKEIN